MDNCLIKGDVFGGAAKRSLLMLHGGGTADRNRFIRLRKDLWHKGVFSSAFDFIGCGDSTGNRDGTCLEGQTKQACRVVEALNMQSPISVLGASMGAYCAVKLLADFKVSNLILFVPAMYSKRACKIPFNNGFTQIIRQPDSWFDSDAWPLLGKFAGNLLIVAAQMDDVIPIDVINRLMQTAKNVHTKTLLTVPGAPHKILDHLYSDPQPYTSRVVGAVAGLMSTKL